MKRNERIQAHFSVKQRKDFRLRSDPAYVFTAAYNFTLIFAITNKKDTTLASESAKKRRKYESEGKTLA